MEPSRWGRPEGSAEAHIFRLGETRALCGKQAQSIEWLDETKPRRHTCEQCCWALDGRHVFRAA